MIKKWLLASVAIFIVGFGFNYLIGLIFPSLAAQYKTALFRPWTDPLMMIYFAFPLITGYALYYLWNLVKIKDPVKFAWSYFIIAGIPGMFITWTSFNVSLGLIFSWLIVGFLEALAAGWVFTKVK